VEVTEPDTAVDAEGVLGEAPVEPTDAVSLSLRLDADVTPDPVAPPSSSGTAPSPSRPAETEKSPSTAVHAELAMPARRSPAGTHRARRPVRELESPFTRRASHGGAGVAR
jgi:hypothetical protein